MRLGLFFCASIAYEQTCCGLGTAGLTTMVVSIPVGVAGLTTTTVSLPVMSCINVVASVVAFFLLFNLAA